MYGDPLMEVNWILMGKEGYFMRKQWKKVLAGVLAGSMALAACMPSMQSDAATAKKEVDLNGKYHAALGIKTCTSKWFYRMGYFFKDSVENPYYGDGSGKADRLQSTKDGEAPGTFTDTEIAGNGEYTVSLSDAEFKGEKHVAVLQVATDIPDSSAITFSNVSVVVNGKEILKFDTGYKEDESAYKKGGMVLLALNQWRMEKTKFAGFKKVIEDAGYKKEMDTKISDGGGYLILNGTGKESVSVTFTVSGFAYNKGETPQAAPAATATAAPAGTKTDGAAANATNAAVKATETPDTQVVAGNTYKLVNMDTEKESATLVKAAKKAKITVPDTIQVNGKNVKVTTIKAGAFRGNKKLTSVKIGKNVTKIEKLAFANCKKLKKIDLKKNTVLKSVGSSAVKGVNKACKVMAPKSKVKAYQKLFKNKGQKVSVK